MTMPDHLVPDARGVSGCRSAQVGRQCWSRPALKVTVLSQIGLLFAACASEPARVPNTLHALDEARAVQLIASTLREAQLEPRGRHEITLSNGKAVAVDVTVANHLYGIAYVLAEEEAGFEGAVPAGAKQQPDALVVAHGNSRSPGARVLVLYSSHYSSDDTAGAEREQSTIAAERRIKRDVRDFVALTRAERWQ